MPDPHRSSQYQDTDTAILRASFFLGAFALLEASIVKAVEFFYHVSKPHGEDLEEIFPISVIGMMRLTGLAFPDRARENDLQE